MVTLLMGLLVFAGSAQAAGKEVRCLAGGHEGMAELIYKQRGFHFPLPPEAVSASLNGMSIEVDRSPEPRPDGSYAFGTNKEHFFVVHPNSEFTVEFQAFGDSFVVLRGSCRPL